MFLICMFLLQNMDFEFDMELDSRDLSILQFHGYSQLTSIFPSFSHDFPMEKAPNCFGNFPNAAGPNGPRHRTDGTALHAAATCGKNGARSMGKRTDKGHTHLTYIYLWDIYGFRMV